MTVTLAQTGTLDGIELVASGAAGQHYDAIWFSSNRYLELYPAAATRLEVSAKVANSPVVLGLRASVAARLGWDRHRPTWSEIASAAGERRFSYAMTNPAASNSGYSALVGVAAALAGTGRALTTAEVTALTPRLRSFFAGQSLTAGSSGWLADAYVQRLSSAQPVDGLVNYESILLSLNPSGKLPEPLTVIYPADGRLVELPFPTRADVAHALVTGFGNALRRPARTIYLLDTSGSMRGARLAGLQSALLGLSGVDTSLSGELTRFNGREQVLLIPFSTGVGEPHRFDLPETGAQPVLDQIRGYVSTLAANGDTAIYDALVRGFQWAAQLDNAEPDRFTTIVLLTDGERTVGRDLAAFQTFHSGLTPALRTVPVFTVLFGEGNVTEMLQVATITGGRTFDARSGTLAAAFKEIRGYQ